MSKETGYPTLL